MRRTLVVSVLGLAVAIGLSCVSRLAVEGAPCPCPVGYCCQNGTLCVPGPGTTCGDPLSAAGRGAAGGGGATGDAGIDGGSSAAGSAPDDARDVPDDGDANVAVEAGGAAGNGDAGAACGFLMPNPAGAGLPNPASYVANGDGTVTDKVTGLTWSTPVYTAARTGGHTAARSACALIAPIGGWRLPTRLELVSLVDFTIAPPRPTIDQVYFSTTATQSFETSTPYAGGTGATWYVNFNNGGTGWGASNAAGWARCVRVTMPACTPKRYDSSGALVVDSATKLTWQRTVDATSSTWSDAKASCAGRGQGWRLPSLTELQTIVDDTKVDPAIDGAAFPNTPSAAFWTSSALAGSSVEAWTIHFEGGYNGSAYPSSVTDSFRVRCVR